MSRTANRIGLAAAALLLVSATSNSRLRAQSGTVAIIGGTVYPVSGPKIERGTVVIRDGRIVAVGANIAVPADAQRIDATGKWVTPGFINVVSTVGLVEVASSAGDTDQRAVGRNNIAASFTPWEAFDSASPLIQSTRNDGITTIGLVPSGNLVSGQHALVDLTDGPAGMLRRAPSAMIARVQDAKAAGTGSRGELFGKLRTLLQEARDWPSLRAAVQENRSRQLLASPADYEALQPVILGSLPLLVEADRATEIDAVLRVAGEFHVKVVLFSASEAWERAEQLNAAGVPVILGGIRNIPDSFDRLNTRDDNAALLRRAGVTVILESDSYGDGDHFNTRNVRFEAGNAVANGLPWDEALRAVTAAPAEVFSIADRVGTLAPDLDANVVVWSGDPFEFSTRAEAVFVRGVRVDRPSRQDELMQRYRTLPPAWR